MPKITKESADRVNDPAHLYDIINDFVDGGLKQVAPGEYKGKSPFNEEKTPSFTVNTTKGIWKCFSSGKGGKSAIKFLMEDRLSNRAMTFPEAAKYVAAKIGFDLEYETVAAVNDARQRLFTANEFALSYFLGNIEADRGQVFKKEMIERRGFSVDVLKHFEVGYTIHGLYNGLIKFAKEKGFPLKDLIEADLVKRNKVDKLYDFFRGRIMFATRNDSGALVGFGGRKVDVKAILPDAEIKEDDSQQPKYKNSKQSQVFNKSMLLYGMHHAKAAIREAGNAYLVEGYTDVLALWMAGVKNVVGSCGTSVTEKHAKLLARYTKKVILFLDPDSAGIRAAGRATEILLKEGIEVQVVVAPEGLDPDEYRLKHGLEALKKLAESSTMGFIDYLLEREAFNIEKIKPAEADRLASKIAQYIAQVPSMVLAERYCAALAKKMQVSTAAVIQMVEQIRSPKHEATNAPKENPKLIPKNDADLSRQCLRLWLLLPPPDQRSLERQWRSTRLDGKWEAVKKQMLAEPNLPVASLLEGNGLTVFAEYISAPLAEMDTAAPVEVSSSPLTKLLLQLKLQLVSSILTYSDAEIVGQRKDVSEEEKQAKMRVHLDLVSKEKALKRTLVEVIQNARR